jgi:hypothetical protein
MSVFDIEQIKRELSVYDPLEPCMIKAIRTIVLLCEEGQKLEKQRDWLANELVIDEACDEPFIRTCSHRKGFYTCTATREEHIQCIIKTAEETVR